MPRRTIVDPHWEPVAEVVKVHQRPQVPASMGRSTPTHSSLRASRTRRMCSRLPWRRWAASWRVSERAALVVLQPSDATSAATYARLTSLWGSACRCVTMSFCGPSTGTTRSHGLSFRMSRATAHSSTERIRWRTSLAVAALTCQMGESRQ